MRRTFSIVALALAWICAQGAIWDVVQVFAWTRMFTGYAETLSVTEALQETFDASKPCSLCIAVRQAKATDHTEGGAVTTRDAVKLVLVHEAPAETRLQRNRPIMRVAFAAVGPVRVEPVPVPPPRG